MLFSVFAIYDGAIKTWLPPIFSRNTGSMLRDFADAVNNGQTNLSKHPSDYALFEIGSWDDDKCVFDLLKTPVKLGLALDYVKIVNEVPKSS